MAQLRLDGTSSQRYSGIFNAQNYILLLIGHGFLGLIFRYVPSISELYAFFLIALGIWWGYNKRLDLVAYWGAYFVGMETLFRMTKGNPIHEFGKYGIFFVFLFALLRSGRRGKWVTPALYMLFLLPGALYTITALPFVQGRQAVSGVLAGPFALAMSIIFYSSIRFERKHLVRLIMAGILPVMGISFIALFSTVSAERIHFSTNSNKATSGGWGPNQVSSGLAFGAYMAFMGYIFERDRKKVRVLMLFLLLLLFSQAAMTFSRSGPYLVVGSIAVASVFYLRSLRAQISMVIGAGIVVLLMNFVIFPQLNEFTGGAFEARVVQDRDLSGRDNIAESDLLMFKEHPVWGVGAGMSERQREIMFNVYNASRDHTEFTRLLAEHGIFGAGAMLIMLFFIIQAFVTTRNPYMKAFRMSASGWAVAYMLVNATRLAAPAFLFGVAFMTLFLEEDIERIQRQWNIKRRQTERRRKAHLARR